MGLAKCRRPLKACNENSKFYPAIEACRTCLWRVFERAYVECMSIVAGTHVFFAEALDTFVADLMRCRPTIFISVPRLWLKFQIGVFEKKPEKTLNFLFKIPILSGIVKKKILAALGLDAVRIMGVDQPDSGRVDCLVSRTGSESARRIRNE